MVTRNKLNKPECVLLKPFSMESQLAKGWTDKMYDRYPLRIVVIFFLIFALALSGVAQQEPEALEGKEQKKLAPVKENDQPADKEGDNPDKSAKGKGELESRQVAKGDGPDGKRLEGAEDKRPVENGPKDKQPVAPDGERLEKPEDKRPVGNGTEDKQSVGPDGERLKGAEDKRPVENGPKDKQPDAPDGERLEGTEDKRPVRDSPKDKQPEGPDRKQSVAPEGKPKLVLGQQYLSFGEVSVGTSKDLELEISNAGDAELKIINFEFNNGSFKTKDVILPLTISPGSTERVSITYTSTKKETSVGLLTIKSNVKDSAVQVLAGLVDVSDVSGTLTLNFKKGLNMISLPTKPDAPYTARTFGQKIGDVSLVARYDTDTQSFDTFIPSIDSDNGFDITGGKGYIVNTTSSKSVGFTGRIWQDPAAPTLDGLNLPDPQWAFVIAVDLPDQLVGKKELYYQVGEQKSSLVLQPNSDSHFRIPMVDQSKNDVIREHEEIEVQIFNATRQLVGYSKLVVEQQDLEQAFKRVKITCNEIPESSRALQNYPNPFNPETWIPFQLDQQSEVALEIYDVNGYLVRSIDIGFRYAGIYFSRDRAIYWDGRSDLGEQVASGIYFYILQTEYMTDTRRMVLLK